jgi:hypothetical protein
VEGSDLILCELNDSQPMKLMAHGIAGSADLKENHSVTRFGSLPIFCFVPCSKLGNRSAERCEAAADRTIAGYGDRHRSEESRCRRHFFPNSLQAENGASRPFSILPTQVDIPSTTVV